MGYWNDIYSKKNYFGTGPTKLAIFAKELLEKNSLQKILELGCGQGRVCLFFAKLGFDVFGFDISQDAIETSENRSISECAYICNKNKNCQLFTIDNNYTCQIHVAYQYFHCNIYNFLGHLVIE